MLHTTREMSHRPAIDVELPELDPPRHQAIDEQNARSKEVQPADSNLNQTRLMCICSNDGTCNGTDAQISASIFVIKDRRNEGTVPSIVSIFVRNRRDNYLWMT